MKGMVYVNNPKTIEQLKDEIRSVIEGIEPQLCKNVIENFDKRMTICRKVMVDIYQTLFLIYNCHVLNFIIQ